MLAGITGATADANADESARPLQVTLALVALPALFTGALPSRQPGAAPEVAAAGGGGVGDATRGSLTSRAAALRGGGGARIG